MQEFRFIPDAEAILSTVYRDQLVNPRRMLIDTSKLRQDLGTQRYYDLVRKLIRSGYLEDATFEFYAGNPPNCAEYLALRLTSIGQEYCHRYNLT